jgi:hypothetical protein
LRLPGALPMAVNARLYDTASTASRPTRAATGRSGARNWPEDGTTHGAAAATRMRAAARAHATPLTPELWGRRRAPWHALRPRPPSPPCGGQGRLPHGRKRECVQLWAFAMSLRCVYDLSHMNSCLFPSAVAFPPPSTTDTCTKRTLYVAMFDGHTHIARSA